MGEQESLSSHSECRTEAIFYDDPQSGYPIFVNLPGFHYAEPPVAGLKFSNDISNRIYRLSEAFLKKSGIGKSFH